MTSKKRKSRRDALLVDRIIVPWWDGMWPYHVQDLRRLWPRICAKHDLISGRDWDEALGRPPKDTDVAAASALTEEEFQAIYEVLQRLMMPPFTDSVRRDLRDAAIAQDFIFHRDFLAHEIVMPGVCARWNVSESTVKQAVRRSGKVASAKLHKMSETHAEDVREYAAIFGATEGYEPLDPNFNVSMSKIIRDKAASSRDPSARRHLPRAAKSARPKKK